MSELIIPAAAATAGWFIGGPTGASIGWTLGSAATAEDAEVELPQIGDLRVQTSTYGTMLPFIVGRQRVAGNVIWTTDKVATQVTERQGGKGGFSGGTETTITTYSVSMAIALCVGPILGVSRVWQDGTIIADRGSSQIKMPGDGTSVLYDGTQTTADPTQVTAEGDAPSYNGLAYYQMNNFDLGASGRVPFFSFEVLKAVSF